MKMTVEDIKRDLKLRENDLKRLLHGNSCTKERDILLDELSKVRMRLMSYDKQLLTQMFLFNPNEVSEQKKNNS